METKISQTEKLYNLLLSGDPIRTDEIVRLVYTSGSLARVGARIFDVKKKYLVDIIGWHDKDNPKLYWYQLVKNDIPLQEMPEWSKWHCGQQQLT